ncbi:battenin-like isoform X2 [Actinia tenebrosa]|nr:battenin-like isoform X2 [Actinia tenebrosa]
MVMTWLAVEDILCGVLLPSTVILISFSFADMLSKCLSPSIVRRISFTSSFVFLTALLSGSVVLIVAVDDVRVRIAGVGLLGLSNGYNRITSVRMLAYYEKAELLASAYQYGINFSTFLTSIGYLGLTTWLRVNPRIAIAFCIPISFFPLVVYALLDKTPLKDHHLSTSQYQPLEVDSTVEHSYKPTATSTSFLTQKLEFLFKVFPFASYTFFSNFCIHLSMVAVLTTLTFPSSPFQPRDHFLYYRLSSDTGIWAGGASLLVSYLCPEWINVLRIRKIWLLVLLNVSHFLFFIFASWFRFLPSVIPVLVLCFTQGVVYGLSLIYSLMDAAMLFPCPKDNGTAMGIVEFGLSLGRFAAGILGIVT